VSTPVALGLYLWLGVLGFVALFQFDSTDDYAGWTLVLAALQVIWWAAIQRASETAMLSRGRRVTACVIATWLIGCASSGVVLAVAEAVAMHHPELGTLASFALVALPVALVVCGRWSWRLLAREQPRRAERALLLAISCTAALALPIDIVAGQVSHSSGKFMAGFVGLMLAIGAGLTLAWCLPTWVVWASSAGKGR
jgi:hypothetical protein